MLPVVGLRKACTASNCRKYMYVQNKKAILHHLGSFLRIPALLCLPTFVVIIIFQEWFALPAFGVMMVLTFGTGQFLFRRYREHTLLQPASALVLISLTWLLIALFGVIPFYGVALSGHPGAATFLDLNSAFFESMSGFSGTGLTMVKKASALPHCLQWWRSATEWFGSMGMIFIATAFLHKEKEIAKIYEAETNHFDINHNYPQTITIIWWLYLALTGLSIIAFIIAGMPVWEAFNHGLTAISTGGFSVKDDSFISYAPQIKLVGNILIILGAISFKAYYLLLFRRAPAKVWRLTQLRYFLAILALLLLGLFLFDNSGSWVDKTFQAASALGTCGLNTVDIQTWNLPVLLLLIIAMNLGGNADSTAGGFKTSRLAWLAKNFKYKLREAWLPEHRKQEIPIRFDAQVVPHEEVQEQVSQAVTILLLWITALVAGCIILSLALHEEFTMNEILFEVSSALNNVGLSTGITGHALRPTVKWTLFVLMWLGRLELYAVVVLFYSLFGSKHK